MQAAGGVHQDHVGLSGPGGVHGVKDHGGRVGPLPVLDDVHLCPVGPDGQLVGGSGPEGVSRGQKHPVPLVLQKVCQLADGSGLPHPVDPDHQDHRGLAGQVQARLSHGKHLHQNLPQAGLHLLRVLELALLHPAAQLLHRLHGGVHAHVGEDQGLFQLLEKLLVHGKKAGEDAQLLDFIKQSHLGFLLLSQFPAGLPPGAGPAAEPC